MTPTQQLEIVHAVPILIERLKELGEQETLRRYDNARRTIAQRYDAELTKIVNEMGVTPGE